MVLAQTKCQAMSDIQSFTPTTTNPAVHAIDAGAAGLIMGTFVGWLPGIAAFLAVVWYLIQIWESRTFTNWRLRRREHKIKKAAHRHIK